MNIEETNAMHTTTPIEAGTNGSGRRRRSFRRAIALAVAVLLAAGLLAHGLWARAKAVDVVRARTDELAIPSVSITQPRLEAGQREIVLPANVQPFINAPIYAQVTGYLKNWYVDIGGRVKKGELLGVIEAPTVDQQLQEARGNLANAQANLQLSGITAKRYSGLVQSDSVSQQATDNAVASNQANAATVQADQANVRTLEAQQAFENVYAPFDGIVTARNTDIGQLIDAGANSGPATELFVVSAINVLRVYVSVPQVYSSLVSRGMSVDLTLPQFADRRFTGTLVRTADAIDPASRTLLVEVDVRNPTDLLLPGAYAEAHFRLPNAPHVYILPDTALIFRSHGLQVATVDSEGKAVLKNIQVGEDFGTTIQVFSGIGPQDQVILNPPDSLVSGEAVHPVSSSSDGGAS